MDIETIRICSGSTQNYRDILVRGTPEQIGLLLKICESLRHGTFIQDMRAVLGVVGTSLNPVGVVYSTESAPQAGGTPATDAGYPEPPRPPLAGENSPVDDDRDGVSRRVRPFPGDGTP